LGLVAVSAAATTTVTAAPAATATAVAATATPAAAATAATETAAGAGLARPSFVDRQGTSTVLLTIQGVDRGLSLVVRRHLNKPEPLAAASCPVADYLGALDSSVLGQQFLQIRAADVITEVSDIQLLAHRSSPVDGNCSTRSFSFMGRF
jgi:hypothetical protein